MRPAHLGLLAFGSGLLFAVIGACGGRVVVDGTLGEGGIGGQGGALPSTGASTFSGPECSFPTMVGKAVPCSATATGGSGTPMSCVLISCDNGDNQFISTCTEQSCICSFTPTDGTETFGCTCQNSARCGFKDHNCCPFPL